MLEAVVIQKGKFRNPITHSEINHNKAEDSSGALSAPTQIDVQALDDERLMSDTDLDRLLDRSADAYARQFGWQSTEGTKSGTQKYSDNALFEVTETSNEAANPTLARIFSGDVDP